MDIQDIMVLDTKEENKRKRNYRLFIENWRNHMIIIRDTREELEDIPIEFKRLGIPFVTKKLIIADFGFYFKNLKILNNDNFQLAIERKKDIDEIIGNFWDKKKDCNGDNRFSRNIKMSLARKYKYIYLCENGNWGNLYTGNYRSKTKPQSIVGKLHSLKLYKITLEFIPKNYMGIYIVDCILYHLRNFYIYGNCELSKQLRFYINKMVVSKQ